MTPTRSQLDEALPPVPSGISALGGDLTEPDEPGSDRATALDWLEKFYAEAHEIGRKQAEEDGPDDLDLYIADQIRRDPGFAEAYAMATELQHCDSGLDSPESDETGSDVPTGPTNETRTYSASEHRDPHEVLHGDRWEVRNGRAVIVGSNDWPAPAKRTHESHLGYDWTSQGSSMIDPHDDDLNGRGGWKEYCHAADWSRTPEREEAK